MVMDPRDRRFDPLCCESTSFIFLPCCVRVFPEANGLARDLSDGAGFSVHPFPLRLPRMAAGTATDYHGRPGNGAVKPVGRPSRPGG
jgi:hypothetical protein